MTTETKCPCAPCSFEDPDLILQMAHDVQYSNQAGVFAYLRGVKAALFHLGWDLEKLAALETAFRREVGI